MSALPTCPECHQEKWQRLLSETDQAWTFGCLHCVIRWVVTKPPVKLAACAHNEAKRVGEITELLRQHESRRRYF